MTPGDPNSHQATTDEQGASAYAQKGRIDGETTALREILLLFLLILLLVLLLLFLLLLLLRKGGSGGHHHRRQE